MDPKNLESFGDSPDSMVDKIKGKGYSNFSGGAKDKVATSMVPLLAKLKDAASKLSLFGSAQEFARLSPQSAPPHTREPTSSCAASARRAGANAGATLS